MEFDKDKIDDMTLALMYLVTHEDQFGMRAWKGFDWSTTDRLHEKGFISDPKVKAKSVALTAEGMKQMEHLFKKYFVVGEG